MKKGTKKRVQLMSIKGSSQQNQVTSRMFVAVKKPYDRWEN